MTSITWLHISDLHACHPAHECGYHEVTERLIDDLNRLRKEHDVAPDMIFFTGDAIFGHPASGEEKSMPDQFAEAAAFMEAIRTTFGECVPKRNVFIVPGNHDVNLTVDNKSLILWLREKADLRKLTDMIHDPNSIWRSYVTKLREYRDFLKTYGYDHLIEDPSRVIYSDIREFNGVKIAIAGFNSAWSSSGKGRREKGKLWLDGDRQLDFFRSTLPKANFSIALMHHPVDWFTRKESPFFLQRLESEFKFLLHGHDHTRWVTQRNEHTRIAAGTCYHHPNKKSGYNVVRLNLEEGTGVIWLREYDPDGEGAWVPCRSDDEGVNDLGVHHLKNVAWLRDLRDTLSIGAGMAKDAGARPSMYAIHSTLERTGIDTIPLLPSRPPRLVQKSYEVMHHIDQIELHEDAHEGDPIRIRDLFLPKEDIDFHIVTQENAEEVPVEEKSPCFHELTTAEHIRRHFIPLPKILNRIDEWLSSKGDLLFTGAPFCGKTSLLTFLSMEAHKRYGSQVPIVRLKTRKDLSIDDVEGAVSRLLQRLEHAGIMGKGTQAIVVIDDVHEPGIFAICRELLRSPRQWRVWAAARCAEYDSISSKDENPWDKREVVKNACDPVGEEDVRYFVDAVLRPVLVARGEEGRIDEIHEAIISIGRVPVRYLCQVWDLITDHAGKETERYASLIRREPTGAEEVVKSVLPRNVPGLKALVISDFLRGPSWELLRYVLAKVEQFGEDLAGTTIEAMRRTLALLDDPEDPDRVFMYAPLQEEIRTPGNLSASFQQEIWEGIQEFLEDWNHIKEEGAPEHLCAFWLSLSDCAQAYGQKEIAVRCAERALEYASGEQEIKALFEIALATNRLTGKWCENTINLLWRAIEKSGQLEKVTLDAAYAKAILGNLFLNIVPPNIKKAVSFLHEAKSACEFLGADSDVGRLNKTLALAKTNQGESEISEAIHHARQALGTYRKLKNTAKEIESLCLLAYCLRMQSNPDWAEAIICYREALKLQDMPEKQADRARTLYQLAFCLHTRPEPVWTEALKVSCESVEILKERGNPRELLDHMVQYAWLCHHQPDPDWHEAFSNYRAALRLLTSPEDHDDRALILYLMAYCLSHQPTPDWAESIAHYREALKYQETLGLDADHALTLCQCALCLHTQPSPDWTGAITLYREALKLLTGPHQRIDRAQALHQLAHCLHNQPEPDWAGAITCYQGVLELLTDPKHRKELSEILYSLAYCLHSQPEPDWAVAITCYERSFDLLTEPDEQADRAQALYQLAFCLHNQPVPEWHRAISRYRQALELFTAPGERSDRAQTYYQLAFCLHNQPVPEWHEAISCYRQALELFTAPEEYTNRALTLYQLAYCLHNQPATEWREAISCYRQALELFTITEEHAERAQTFSQLAFCLHNQPAPEWREAISCYCEALTHFIEPEHQVERALILCQLAFCQFNQPQPDWTEAVASYREALTLLYGPEHQAERAQSLHRLAYCLYNQTEPDWAGAITASLETIEITKAIADTRGLLDALIQYAWLCHNQLYPDWAGAIDGYREALDLLGKPRHKGGVRAQTLYQLGLCLYSQTEPNWPEAITCFMTVLEIQTENPELPDRGLTMYQMAFCFHNQQEPDWSRAITCYRKALEFLKDPGQRHDRARALFQLASCFHTKPNPDWEEAIACYREALELQTDPEQADDRARTLVQLGSCLHDKPQPDLPLATIAYEEALELQTDPDKRHDRASTFFHLASCLHTQPQPDLVRAVACYRAALEIQTDPEQQLDRARTNYWLAYCLHNLPEPDWTALIQASRESVETFRGLDRPHELLDALIQHAWLCYNQPEPDWGEAIESFRQIIALQHEPHHEADRARSLYLLAYCLHNQPDPDWSEAIRHYREALELQQDQKHRSELAITLYQLAYCLQNRPEPDWSEAIRHYQEAMELVKDQGKKADQALILFWLASCLHNQPEPDWSGALEASRESVAIFRELNENGDLQDSLMQYAWLCHNQPEPDWDKAIEYYREALEFQTNPDQQAERAITLYQLGSCFHYKPGPDWDQAIHYYNQALALQTAEELPADRARTLCSLAFCCQNNPKPDWHRAIQHYREAIELLPASEQRSERARILYQLANCLSRQPEPDWDSAGRYARDALDLSRVPGERIRTPLPPSLLASIFEEMSSPDLDAAINFRRETVEATKNVNSIFELIVAVDRKGEFEEGDYWARKVQDTRLIDIDEPDREALEGQRMAFLELRRDSLDGVLTIADRLRNGPQHPRALSLAAIAHFAREENDAAYQDIVNAQASREDISWLRKIAEGYFRRYSRDKLGGFLKMVEEAFEARH